MSKLFGLRLKELRERENLSQKHLSNVLECSQSVVCDWENGRVEPKESNIIKISKYFEVSSDYLLGLMDDIVY